MKITNPFQELTKFEWGLWGCSALVVTLSFLFAPDKDYLTLIASLIGVTTLIFVAKGLVFGQILSVVFSLFYGIISFHFRYYGEMLTYLCMTTPIAIFSIISWLKNPYKETAVVEVRKQLTRTHILFLGILSVVITIIFYFILKAFNTANLLISTISITTSFLASCLTFLRSPFYACAYALNDIILIILWVLATIANPAYLPMIFCFLTFLVNDLYAFFNWKRIEKSQSNNE